ncbi:MAG: Hsp70 family protein [Deltaproteobacteria bacterium]|nr:Hsp70 family protein [Deltaproteobacteria bacterium]
MPKSPLIYAIDFGTSNSLLAAATPEGELAPIPLDVEAPDPTILRSILYFPSMNECFYGQRAIDEFTRHDMEGRLVRSIKKYLPVRSFVGTYVDNRPLNLEDIIAIFLGELRRRANAHFDADVDSVVLGRPAKFSGEEGDDAYAQYRLERAARGAGFKHIEFLAEPLAAAFDFRGQIAEPKLVCVADFGGGTSDFTVVRIRPDGYDRERDVLSIGGVSVAGDALDGAVMRGRIARHFGADVEYKVPFGSNVLRMPRDLMEKICSPADISLLRERDTFEFLKNVRTWSLGGKDREKMDRLFCLIEDQLGFKVFEEIERTKRALSDAASAKFVFDYPGAEVEEKFTLKGFEELIAPKTDAILTSLDETVAAAGLKFADIDLVCCTGGTARVAVLRRALEERFGVGKLQQHNNFHSIVRGLSSRARQLF